MNNKSIYIVSATYPFGKGEEFVSKELKELSKFFYKIYLFPLSIEGEKRWIPQNVELNLNLAQTKRTVSSKQFILNTPLIIKILGLEFLNSGKKKFILSNWRDLANSILQSKLLSEAFAKQIKDLNNSYFYSIWMNDGALLFSILKHEKKIPDFVFRLHGYDLFDERREGQYMPFRYFNFLKAKRIFILSQAGYNYLKNKKKFIEKLVINYSGLYDNGSNPFNPENIFTIVSCSNIIQLKRIDKIIKVLSHIDFPVKWIHFGDGILIDQIKKTAKTLPSNIDYSFKGYVQNEEIITYYKSNSINLFIHLSDSEGLGMAIVEAQSFGIPALATNVGGVSEVVNENTGVLVMPTEKEEIIAEEILKIKSGKINKKEFRVGVKQFWERTFNAKINYNEFCSKILD